MNELIRVARETITKAVKKEPVSLEVQEKDPEEWKEYKGCFVTINKNNELRGCIGYPLPVMPLGTALRRAAKAAALEDPRFEPLSEEELKEIKIEVSVLTKPEEIKEKDPEKLRKEITPGKHGLIISKGLNQGLLLPQVFSKEQTVEEMLEMTCIKAGLPINEWKKPETKIYKFEAKIYEEE